MTYRTADGRVLTDEALEAEAEAFERGERPAGWGGPVFRVTIADEHVDELMRRAASRNESADEHISNVIGAILATA